MTERILMRYSASMETISFCYSGQFILNSFYLHKPYILSSLCNMHTLEHSETIDWVHFYNFYLLKPYIFVIIVQYAYSRTFCIYKLSLLFTTFKLHMPNIFITIVKYVCSRTFSPLQAMKYVLVFCHHYAIPGRIKRPPFRSRFSLGFTGRTTTTLLNQVSLYIFIFP